MGLRQAGLVAHQAHQVLGVAAVVQGEALRQAQARRVLAQEPRADGVEGAGPGQARRRLRGRQLQHALQHGAGALRHLLGGAPAEGEQQQALRVGAVADQVGHAVGQGVGLARTRARDDEQRAGVGGAVARAVGDGR